MHSDECRECARLHVETCISASTEKINFIAHAHHTRLHKIAVNDHAAKELEDRGHMCVCIMWSDN